MFFPASPRAVDAATAAALVRRIENRAIAVGLFVAPNADDVGRVLDAVPLYVLQVYADADTAVALRDRFGLPVWLAHGVRTSADLPVVATVDRLVIESKPPIGAGRPGGNGVRFDWSITAGWRAPAPWLLAGGLTADNVADALIRSDASAVDVSSGVERAPGVKDPALITRFVAAARGR